MFTTRGIPRDRADRQPERLAQAGEAAGGSRAGDDASLRDNPLLSNSNLISTGCAG